MITELIKELNPEQKQAVVADLTNILVLAGAGSGKTKVLVSRIAWLIAALQLSAHEILAVTFTNKAAKEMQSRLRNILKPNIRPLRTLAVESRLQGDVAHKTEVYSSVHEDLRTASTEPDFSSVEFPNRSIDGMWVGTFHGLSHRLLQIHYQEAKLPAQFHILDSDDQARLIKRIMQSLNIDTDKWPVKLVQNFINSKKDDGLRPSHIYIQSFDEQTKLFVKIYKAYMDACQSSGLVDFAELLLRAFEILRDNQDLLSFYQNKFKAILVDEFQDTNSIQYAWIKLLAGDKTKVMAVGDDDQSIYAWRGAKVENIIRFTRDFADAKIIRLEQNYRSTATILDAANSLISNNSGRMGKNLWTNGANGELIKLFAAFNELEEARFIADEIKREVNNGRDLNAIAVLYRANAQSRVIEEALLQSGIAYKIYGGMRFYERAEIKDALAYLRLVVNRDDSEAFERIVNFPTRGIGENTLNALREVAMQKQISHWQAINFLTEDSASSSLADNNFIDSSINSPESFLEFPNKSKFLSQRALNALLKFTQLIARIAKDIKDKSLADKIHYLLELSGLYEYYQKSKNDVAESKLQNLQELVNAAKQFEDTQQTTEIDLLMAFLAHASLEAGEMQADDYEQHVHMMTIHAAKGLEFPLVFIAGMEEGVFPSKQANDDFSKLEEERRLCYVGMTRAMQKLVLSHAEIRRQYGREEYHRPSRFIKELPAEFLEEVRVKTNKHHMAFVNKSNNSQLDFTKITSAVENNVAFELGKNVTHPKFGSGVILAFEGFGANARVQVKFTQHGVKWLVLAYANLT